jgi:transcription elongation factor B subunit 2
MEEDKTLADCGLTSSLAKAQSPAEVGLAFALDGGVFEDLEKTPYSSPPELPDVMKPGQETTTQETATA